MNVPFQNAAGDLLKRKVVNLHGTIEDELTSSDSGFSAANVRLLRYHGIFQQDNRDERHQHNGPRHYQFMVRIRATGGKLSAWQFLGLLDLADELGDANLHITSRQGIQLAGIEKAALRPAMRYIADLQLTTLATGGDAGCNIMCCPAAQGHASVNDDLQATADKIDAYLAPQGKAYGEIWQRDRPSMHRKFARPKSSSDHSESIDEAILLPQKFKIGLATANDNCTEVFAQDLGLLAVTEDGRVVGYNVLVGGNMRNYLSVATRSSALAQPLAYIDRDDAVPLVSAIVSVFRDYGNRSDHSRARLKYLIQDWGIDRFKQAVEDRFAPLKPPRSIDVVDHKDHLGWQRQDLKKWSVGIHLENGCFNDKRNSKVGSALRKIADRFACSFRLTPQRNILVCDIDSSDCLTIDTLLSHHDVPAVGSLSNVRRFTTGCPGLPACSSSITESQRMLPGIIAELESEIARLGLTQERFTLRMTGCPFGCTRSYLADIAIVGRTVDPKTKQGKYAIFLGGDSLGRRLNTLYKDLVPADQVMATLRPLLHNFCGQRLPGETLGDFFVRTNAKDS
ncbi:MAG: NADPH-dependent assimilatory sulfite reductase hemoprotein subunit [Pirellulaceae bacterium]|jgi:sulfite reductase (ferredoxin)|nr:NADPH-dependent assimilatory sulfite reductase hemoprotein subunit [Pirellulaceae bacterium]MDP6557379.1 NADPH-dependent assimilatory sulfite reductase hemoprotein subunit [Pirellulaceae bacterium]